MNLEITTSLPSILNVFFELSNVTSTNASLAGFTNFEPENNKLVVFSALIDFADKRPRAKHKASDMLLFPQPFGPTTTVIPLSNITSVLLANDLKPCITIFLI